MNSKLVVGAVLLAAVSSAASAQNQARRMTIVGGGASDRGKCTIEVVVDGAAEVEIRGDTATLRNLSGAAPQWRRFECSGPLPRNPGDFRFVGVDGRGQQQLVRDPRNGGPAVIRIGDRDNGSEGYTFDILWSNAPPMPYREQGDDRRWERHGDDLGRADDHDGDGFYRERADVFRGDSWRMHLFSRIEADLNHVQALTFPFGEDQYRLARAKQELSELQNTQGRGRYARRQLDDVVATLRAVSRDNRLRQRDREILNDDVSRLLDLRARWRGSEMR